MPQSVVDRHDGPRRASDLVAHDHLRRRGIGAKRQHLQSISRCVRECRPVGVQECPIERPDEVGALVGRRLVPMTGEDELRGVINVKPVQQYFLDERVDRLGIAPDRSPVAIERLEQAFRNGDDRLLRARFRRDIGRYRQRDRRNKNCRHAERRACEERSHEAAQELLFH